MAVVQWVVVRTYVVPRDLADTEEDAEAAVDAGAVGPYESQVMAVEGVD